MIEALRPASKEEEHAIREMIGSGFLQTSQKSGVKVWKWKKPTQRKAA
jgi:hypothetical protein